MFFLINSNPQIPIQNQTEITYQPKVGSKQWGIAFLKVIAVGWRGATLGAISATLTYFTVIFLSQHLGWGFIPLDVLLAFLIPAILLGLCGALVDLAFLILRLVTRLLGWVLAKIGLPQRWATLPNRWLKAIPDWFLRVNGGIFLIFAIYYFPLGRTGAEFTLLWIFTLLETLTGGIIGLIISHKFQLRKPLIIGLLALPIALNLASGVWLFTPGTDDYLVAENRPTQPVPQLNITNPGDLGTYQVKTLFYGSGSDQHRSEYGTEVNLKTEAVDASKILPEWSGFGGDILTWLWGFNPGTLPLNGRVWYPAGNGPFPLVLLVHGNHAMQDFSDPGYSYLGEFLASRGFIAVSVDENFLNGWAFGDFNNKENPVRAWLLLQHLKIWQGWNENSGTPFSQKVDFKNIALVGHSRGGETVALAAGFASWRRSLSLKSAETEGLQFPIKAVVAIAPADTFRSYNSALKLKDVNYLVLQGAHDSDVMTFTGSRQYQDTYFSSEQYNFKSSVYIYRANHNQFNTVWGSSEFPPPVGWALNQKPLLSTEEQRQVAKTYIGAFLEASLHAKQDYLPFLRNHYAAQSWLPKDIYITQFADSNFKLVNDFESSDRTTTSILGGTIQAENMKSWEQQSMVYRDNKQTSQRNRAVFLAWEQATNGSEQNALYTITLPNNFKPELDLQTHSRLAFSLGTLQENAKSIALTVELIDKNGQIVHLPLNHVAPIQNGLKTQLRKADWLEDAAISGQGEQVLQTYELPLSEFIRTNPQFNPANLSQIRFSFNRSGKGEVFLDNLGFFAQ